MDACISAMKEKEYSRGRTSGSPGKIRRRPGKLRKNKGTAESGQSSTTSPDDFVLVGKIVKVVGLKGLVRVYTFSDNPDRFSPESILFLKGKDKSIGEISVLEIKPVPGKEALNVLFKNYDTPEKAADLVGKELGIFRKDRRALPDHFFPDEFPGMKLISSAGKPEGTVIALEIEVPSPYLLVRSDRHGELMIPFRKVYIDAVDMAKREVRLSMPIQTHLFDDN